MIENTHCSVPVNPVKHLGLVRMVANRYVKRGQRVGISYEDIFQTGVIGLLKAIPVYDPTKWTFSTYAVTYIRHEISRYFDNHASTVRIPAYRQHGSKKADDVVYGVSMDQEITEDGGTLHDVLGDSRDMERDYYAKEVGRLAADHLNEMSATEQYIMMRRYWDCSYEPDSIHVIGRAVGISGERVRQIERSVLNKMRKRIEARP